MSAAAASRSAESSMIMASLPPISVMTRLIQRWFSICPAASSFILKPVFIEPVNEMKPDLRAVPRHEVHDAWAGPGFLEDLSDLRPEDRGVLRGLHDDGVAGDDGRARHPREDGGREVPRRDDDPYPHRLVEVAALLAGDGVDLHAVLQAEHLAGVVLEEVYGLGELRVGLGPGLAALVDLPGEHLELAPAHDRRRPEEDARPCLGRRPAPRLERLRGGLERHIRLALAGGGDAPYYLRGMRGVDRDDLAVGLDSLSADDQRVAPIQRAADLFEGGAHGFDVRLVGPV